jgi:hypothetical protein
MNSKNILVAEDNPDDAFIFQMMFRKAGIEDRLHMVEDGEQVIGWLEGRDGWRRKFFSVNSASFKLKTGSGFAC